MRSGCDRSAPYQFQRRHAVRRRDYAVALVAKQMLQQIAQFGIVLNHQHRAGAADILGCSAYSFVKRAFTLRQPIAVFEFNLDCEDRALARLRADADLMTEQIRQAFDD